MSAVVVNYNVPGIKKPLKFNATVLSNIYKGKITTWNDPAIKAINPGVTLPNLKIVPLHRADSSGTTFVFVSYLNAGAPSVWSSSLVGTTVSWPSVPGATAETGNGGMVKGCGTIKGCIAYIGVSYRTQAQAAGLGEGELASKSGQDERPVLGDQRCAGHLRHQDPSQRRPGAHLRRGWLPGHQLRVRDRETTQP